MKNVILYTEKNRRLRIFIFFILLLTRNSKKKILRNWNFSFILFFISAKIVFFSGKYSLKKCKNQFKFSLGDLNMKKSLRKNFCIQKFDIKTNTRSFEKRYFVNRKKNRRLPVFIFLSFFFTRNSTKNTLKFELFFYFFFNISRICFFFFRKNSLKKFKNQLNFSLIGLNMKKSLQHFFCIEKFDIKTNTRRFE